MNSHTVVSNRLTLPGGRFLHIRELRPGEHATVRRLFARLSPRTRYLRFHSSVSVLTESLLRTLAGVDARRLALVAELDDCDSGNVVGLANVVAGDDDRAEVGLVVADAWHRQRIGVALAVRLLLAAEARGYDRFVTHELSDNLALRPFLRRVADVVSITTSFGVSEITFVRRRSALEQAYERILATSGGGLAVR
jgi:GNAT superfamily N-acetyltransferase